MGKIGFILLYIGFASCFFAQNNAGTEPKGLLTRDKLELFFEQSLEPYAVNDWLIPITDLKASYDQLTIKFYVNGTLSDSTVYRDRSTEFELSKSGKIVAYDYLQLGKRVKKVYLYDKNDKLIETHYQQNQSNLTGGCNYAYSKDYSEMYKIYHNPVAKSIDTARYYAFDADGKITLQKRTSKDLSVTSRVTYNEMDLISAIESEFHFSASNTRDTLNFNYSYTYNAKGDWTDLEIKIKSQPDNVFRIQRIFH